MWFELGFNAGSKVKTKQTSILTNDFHAHSVMVSKRIVSPYKVLKFALEERTRKDQKIIILLIISRSD